MTEILSSATTAEDGVTKALSCMLEGRLRCGGDWEQSFGQLGMTVDGLMEALIRLEDTLRITIDNTDLNHRENFYSPHALADLLIRKVTARTVEKPRVICIVSDFLPHISGPQRVVADLCGQLSEWFEFHVYTLDLAEGLAAEEQIDGIQVKRFEVPRLTDVTRLKGRIREMSGYPGLPSEIFCNYSIPSSDLFHAIQESGAGVIATFFYSTALSQGVVEPFPSKRWVFMPVFFQKPGDAVPNPSWWDPTRVDRLVLAHEREYRRALEYGFPAEKLTLIPLGVDTDLFRPNSARRDTETLLYVGRLTPNKGLRAFLPVLRRVVEKRPGVRLRVIADLNPPSLLEQEEIGLIRRTIDQLGLQESLELSGKICGKDLVEAYSSHQIHILPSRGDYYSMATLEALACGMTSVVLDRACYGWQRETDRGVPLVHLCRTLQEMGDKILQLFDRGEFVSHRNLIVEKFGWRQLRHEYHRVLI